jgi:hypothetical protein
MERGAARRFALEGAYARGWRRDEGRSSMRLGQPVLATKAIDTLELRQIARYDNQPSRAAITGDQEVIAVDTASRRSCAARTSAA